MNTLAAIAALSDLVSAATILLSKAQEISAVVQKAQAENRDVTKEEMDAVVSNDDNAKMALHAAILKHGA